MMTDTVDSTDVHDGVAQFATEHGVELTASHEEGVRWLIHMQEGPMHFTMAYFNDEDGEELTLEIDNLEDGTSVFGYVDPRTLAYEAVSDDLRAGPDGDMLTFKFHGTETVKMALTTTSHGDVRYIILSDSLQI